MKPKDPWSSFSHKQQEQHVCGGNSMKKTSVLGGCCENQDWTGPAWLGGRVRGPGSRGWGSGNPDSEDPGKMRLWLHPRGTTEDRCLSSG